MPRDYRNNLRAPLFMAFCGVLVWAFGLGVSTLYKIVDALAVLEFIERKREKHESLLHHVGDAKTPRRQELIRTMREGRGVSVRFYGTYDRALNQLDARLFGTTDHKNISKAS